MHIIITFSSKYIRFVLEIRNFRPIATAHLLNASLHFIVVNGVAEYYDSTYSFFIHPVKTYTQRDSMVYFYNKLFSQIIIIIVSHAAKFIF